MEIYILQLHTCTIYKLEKTLRSKGNILLEEGMLRIGNPPPLFKLCLPTTPNMCKTTQQSEHNKEFEAVSNINFP